MLSTTCDPIVNKPKQDGDKKEDGKDDENTGQQPAQNKKIQRTTCTQVNHIRLATRLAQNILCILAPLISIRMLTERHFINGKLIFKYYSVIPITMQSIACLWHPLPYNITEQPFEQETGACSGSLKLVI